MFRVGQATAACPPRQPAAAVRPRVGRVLARERLCRHGSQVWTFRPHKRQDTISCYFKAFPSIWIVARAAIDRKDAMEPRKRAEGHTNQPAVQVVGFAWRGGTPSPDPASGSILQGEDGAQIGASPVPVIIPPQFQVCGAPSARLVAI